MTPSVVGVRALWDGNSGTFHPKQKAMIIPPPDFSRDMPKAMTIDGVLRYLFNLQYFTFVSCLLFFIISVLLASC